MVQKHMMTATPHPMGDRAFRQKRRQLLERRFEKAKATNARPNVTANTARPNTRLGTDTPTNMANAAEKYEFTGYCSLSSHGDDDQETRFGAAMKVINTALLSSVTTDTELLLIYRRQGYWTTEVDINRSDLQEMNLAREEDTKIAVVGLGYVGLSLALALAKRNPVIGCDLDSNRVVELRSGYDRTGEVSLKDAENPAVRYVDDLSNAGDCNIFIIAVPTPIDDQNNPDLTALESASRTVGDVIRPGSIVVFESTVFPGATEDFCGPILEAASGMECGRDFFLGYSPERINPGDSEHTIDKVIKVVAGQTQEVAAHLAEIYGAVIPAGVHVAPDIRTAEAAKVIENAQRDINIAFINEVTKLFHRLGLDTASVLAVARTKWNFLDFRPGLVGGHCIGVDPYYLAHVAETADFDPEIILAGRRINDGMAGYIAQEIDRLLGAPRRILVMGLTFKENVSDIRNSHAIKLILTLKANGHDVEIFDPVASAQEVEDQYRLMIQAGPEPTGRFDAIVGAVAHDQFFDMLPETLEGLLNPQGLLVDLKEIWPVASYSDRYRIWRL